MDDETYMAAYKGSTIAVLELAHRYLTHPEIREIGENFALPISAVIRRVEDQIFMLRLDKLEHETEK